jgi:trk system potassium uptake protein TrkH
MGVSPMQSQPVDETFTPVIVELIGAALVWPMFVGQPDAQGRPLSSGGAVWYAVFHSVSAFCNSGLTLYDDSLRPFREHWQVLGVLAPMIVLGGLGLPVLGELLTRVRTLPRRLARTRRLGLSVWRGAVVKFSLHGKVVLWTTLLLLFFGTTTLLLVETISMNIQPAEPGRNFGSAAEVKTEFQSLSATDRLRACAFLSVSSRTGGFRTCETSHLSDAGKAVLCLLMGIGGSPGSAAGGMKTVTFAVLFVAVAAGLGRRNRPAMFGRSVAGEVVGRAVALAGLYVALVCVVSVVLAVVTRSHGRFLDLLFESVSACSNAGLTSGATATINDPGKFVLMFAMLAGRLLPMVFLSIVLWPRGTRAPANSCSGGVKD